MSIHSRVKGVFSHAVLCTAFSALFLLGAGPLSPAQAAVFNVTKTADTNDGSCTVADCSLREAIVAANAIAGPHTINIPAGTYTLTIAGIGEDAAATGDLDISESMTISGAGAGVTIINGGALDRVFDIDPNDNGPTVVIQNLTITGGDEPFGNNGGGVFNNWSGCAIVTLTNVAVTGNAAFQGGGVANQGCGGMTITNSTISGNTAAGGGGGIYNNYPLTITNSTISGNVVQDGSGGGIENATYATASLLNVTLVNNSALGGNGIFVDFGATASLNNTIVANNGIDNCATAGGTITDGGNNLQYPGATCGATIPTADPLLGALALNPPGTTQTHALLAGSPAIDTANNATCPATDQRGVTRPIDGDAVPGAVCDIGAYEAPAAALADLSVTKTDSPDPVTVGNSLAYTITITNNGPNNATGVTLTDTLPVSVTFVSATPSQGSCSGTSTVTCNLGTINNSASATVTIIVTPTQAGNLTNTASVTSTVIDPNAANNSATATTTVNEYGPPDLLQTGQTTSYATGDDGDLQAGVPWPSPRFVASGDCVRDELTGLMWPRNANLFGPRTWSQALNDAEGLSLCDYSDWRLSNIQELASLGHAGQSDTAAWLRGQGFTNVQASHYWSSTTYVGPTLGPESALRRPGVAGGGVSPQAAAVTSAWVLYLPDGNVDALEKGTRLFVWPVRDGAGGLIGLPRTGQMTSYAAGDDGDLQAGVPWPSPRFTVSGACVIDDLTGLMWRQQPDGVDRSWESALGYANSLTLCGYNDWRLPNRTELRSLIHNGRLSSAAWLNEQGFSGVQDDFYWTATTYAGDTAWGWMVNLGEGAEYIADKFFMAPAWPVRGGGSGADLSVTKTDSPDPVAPGGALTYTLTVTNQGPDAATNVQLTDTLPAGVTFVSVTPGSPTCTQAGGVVICNLGGLASGASAQVTIQVTAPGTAGAMTNTASVASSVPDLNPANNTATAVTTVGTGGGSCTGTGPYTMSGRVSSGISGVGGVTMSLTGPGGCTATATTNTRGRYQFGGLGNGTYAVSPAKAGCTFDPPSRNATVAGGNVRQVNFRASCP